MEGSIQEHAHVVCLLEILTEDELVNWVNAHPDSGILSEENARMLFKTMDVNEDQVVTFSGMSSLLESPSSLRACLLVLAVTDRIH
ncbi:hypothetical protein APSETT444_006137 [Aspergillus pseudonomiae]